MMKTVLIIFPDEWISYSPSTLNLISELDNNSSFDVELICFDNGRYPILTHDIKANCHIIKINRWLVAGLSLIGLHFYLKQRLIVKKANELRFDIVISIDLLGLQAALLITEEVHFLSLELTRHILFKKLDSDRLGSVLIQSPQRYKYLFGDRQHRVFYLQNAPSLRDVNETATEKGESTENEYGKAGDKVIKLICLGNLIPRHGIYQCADLLARSRVFQLTLAGRIPPKVRASIVRKYADHIANKQLVLTEDYIPQHELVDYLRKFDIGLCFYDFNLIKNGDFNYLSSPSGKIFNYFAAGLPVVGNNILGLKPIEQFNAGVLVDWPSTEQIKNAIERIFQEYDAFSSRALEAAAHFDFHKNVQPFIKLLQETGGSRIV